VVVLLLAPGVWSAATAFGSSGGALAQAGPSSSAFGRGGFDPARGELPARFPARFGGAMRGELTADQRKILAYAQAHSGGTPITLAVEGGAMAAAPYLIHSDAAVVGMGGFSGQDPAPSAATLAQWVQQNRLRFVLAGGDGPGRAGPGGDGRAGRAGRGGVSAQRTQWVQQHCAAANPDSYGGSASPRSNTAEPSDRAAVLYDCKAR